MDVSRLRKFPGGGLKKRLTSKTVLPLLPQRQLSPVASSLRIVTAPTLSQALSSLASSGGFSGTFELHLTVPPLDPAAEAHFLEVCPALGLKPVLIHAPGAHLAYQPMTSSYLQGPIELVAENTLRLIERLSSSGLPVLRCKLEATLVSRGVPVSDLDVDPTPGRYFEFHAKLLLRSPLQIEPLRLRCLQLGAHLSSNAFRVRADLLQERFVTLRIFHAGRETALARFRSLLSSLRDDGYPTEHLLHEYSVLDTNSLLDQGWIALPSSP